VGNLAGKPVASILGTNVLVIDIIFRDRIKIAGGSVANVFVAIVYCRRFDFIWMNAFLVDAVVICTKISIVCASRAVWFGKTFDFDGFS